MKTNKTNLKSCLLVAAGAFSWTACEKDNDPKPGGATGDQPAIELECDYFETQNRVLTDDPNAPVDYLITCEADVYKNLTIEPGVVVAFAENASLRFKEASSFKIEGTAAKPVVFTGVTPEKGFWRGILVEKTNKPSNSMKYVIIEYAGSNSTSHVGYPEAGLQVVQGGIVSIDHCTFRYNQGNGLYWNGEKSISITQSTFTKNDYPMETEGWNQIKLYNNTNDYQGNEDDWVQLTYPGISNEKKDIVWRKINVPYQVRTRIYNRFDVDNANLTIEPGVEVIMATAETHIRILDDASISAVGTADDPIVFRGKDDVQAAWGYILVSSGSALNKIAHVNIQHAGNSMSDVQAAVQVDYNSYLQLHDANFINNAGYAVGMLYHGGMSDPVLDYNNITVDNGKMFCKGANGDALSDPNDPNS